MEFIQPHIQLSKKQSTDYALLPGDPGRIKRIAGFLEEVKELANNREYCSISGTYKGVGILAVSTGIGGPSLGIAVEELKNIGVKTLIRIGSCGALQKDLKLGNLLIATGAVRNEGTSLAYVEQGYPAVPDADVLFALLESAKEQGFPYQYGRIRSHDSFYTDQEEEINRYWSQKGILGSDMESAALFVIGGLRGVKTGSVLNVVVEKAGNLECGINDYVDGDAAAMDGEKREIITALEAVVKLANNK
ncbi:MAG TPA: uridine phosphorylase [Firmicutes bacterium]|jgi:uridine phosphorylase|nr:uridine phosphorylase [Bacillota bacterium]HBK67494.1 uridine phosphorylase [Bacillota bacterium]